MKVHPLCKAVPEMGDDEFDVLVADMKANGYDVRFPIVTLDGMILDGRHRYKAAAKAEVEPKVVEFKGSNPAAFVLRSNKRRNLTASQRAAMAAELLPEIEKEADARMKAGKGDPGQKVAQGRSSDLAADAVGTNREYVKTAKAVREKSPETFEAMKAGKVSMAEAKAAIAPKPPERPKDGRGKTADIREVRKAIESVPVFEQLIRDAQALRRGINHLADRAGGDELATGRAKEMSVAIDHIIAQLKNCTPYTTCPYMPNCETGKCKTCKGKKWVTEQVWNHIPAEVRR